MTKTSLIIPVFNQLQYTQDCLETFFEHHPDPDLEVIVVNNGSTDGTREYLAGISSDNSRLRVIDAQKNLGYTWANNSAAKAARGEYLILLNNDTLSFEPWVGKLVSVLEKEKQIGACGAKLLYPGWELINTAGYVYSSQFLNFYPIYEMMEDFLPAANQRRSYQALLGACLALRRESYLSLGGLREIGLEDIDLCLRISESGLRVEYVPEASLFHYGSVTLHNSTAGEIPQMNTLEFNKTWAPKLKGDDLDFYRADGYSVKEIVDKRVLLDRPEVLSYGLLTLAILYIRQSRNVEAEKLLREAIELRAQNRVAKLELVLLLTKTNRLPEAMAISEKLCAEHPNFFSALMCQIQFLVHQGRSAEVSKLLENLPKISRILPSDLRALQSLKAELKI